MATFGYGRVSTADQEPANQRLEIEQAGYDIDDETWFADVVSGKVAAMQRPQFVAMLERMRKGERLVVTKLDRLGRDAIDVQTTVRMLAARKIEVIVLQLGKVDLASSAGKLLMTMLAAVAEMERDLLVERTQAGLARAKAQGKQLGRPTKTSPKQRTDIMNQYNSGASISSLARTYGISRASVLAIVKPDDAARQEQLAKKVMQDDADILKTLARN
jgi:putative DNA-invertase from lambdoid prophage Rac